MILVVIWPNKRKEIEDVMEIRPSDNPYQVTAVSHDSQMRRNPWQLRPQNLRIFLIVFAAIGIAGLFIPTIELFQLNVSLGRAPVWLAYVGIFAPEYWHLALPIIFVHLFVSFAIASIVDWLACTRPSLLPNAIDDETT